jgi:GT2 family glycosyltransferase
MMPPPHPGAGGIDRSADAGIRGPVVSVLIANYNGAELIEPCIRSVLDQRCEFPFEVIVHDDASTDGSAGIVKDRFPEIALIESAKNVGFCVANNRMARQARGEFLLLLNNDATLMPGAIEALFARAREIACPAALGLPEYDAVSGDLVARGHHLDPFLNPVPNLDSQRYEVGLVIGACLWIPAALWSELGGFPEWFGSIGEDLYLCCRVRLLGYPLQVVQETGFRHLSGASFGGGKLIGQRMVTSVRRRVLTERNKTFVMAICYPSIALAAILPLHATLLLLEGVALMVVKRDYGLLREIYLGALAALWAQRSRLLGERRRVQASRRIGLSSFFGVFTPLPHKFRMLLKHGFPQIRRR